MAAPERYDKLLRDYDKHCLYIANMANVEIHESIEDKAKRIKKLERNYADWFTYYFPNYAKSTCAWFHILLANLLFKNKVINLLLEWYRSAAKSVHADMGVPLWLMVQGQLKFMLLIGETDLKAKKLLSGIQAQLQYNKRFINDYGAKFQHGDWAEGDFTTTDGIKFMSLGFGQSPRGAREAENRPDYIVVDDVDNRKHVNNDRLMREAVEYITEDVFGCFDADETNTNMRFVFANNNFHKNSITNKLKILFNSFIDKAKKNKETSPYRVISVAAVKNLTTFEPEWPSKTSALYWRKKFANTTYRSFMREYMHKHIEDGKVFKSQDIQYRKPIKLDKYEALCLYGDMSYKAQACHKGLVLVGKIGREFDIIHVFLRQQSRKQAAEWLYDLYEHKKLDRFNIRYEIEGLFAMDDFVNDFDEVGDERGYYVPVVANKEAKGDKYDRIEALAGFFERHNVYFNEDEKDSADMIELVDQFLAFEKGSNSPVDGPDATQGAFTRLNKTTFIQKN